MMKKLKIGTVVVDHPAGLAPMAGVTDLPFRILCREQGCSLFYTEMVSAKAMYYKNKNTKELLLTEKGEHPLAVQLFGSEPELMAEMGLLLSEGPFDIIDVNMGCPVPKVVNNQEGSALMKNPELAFQILNAMAKKIKKPVTVKFRTGFDESHKNAVEFAKMAEAAGVAAVAVHGRTREQYYSGKADWDMIARVKAAVSIPVLGNGDIFTAADGVRMMEETGCDGILAARGAKGNPWLFRELKAAFAGEPVPGRPSMEEIKNTILRHAALQLEYKGEYVTVREMRKHIAWYTAGLPGASALRAKINEAQDMKELKALVEKYFSDAYDEEKNIY